MKKKVNLTPKINPNTEITKLCMFPDCDCARTDDGVTSIRLCKYELQKTEHSRLEQMQIDAIKDLEKLINSRKPKPSFEKGGITNKEELISKIKTMKPTQLRKPYQPPESEILNEKPTRTLKSLTSELTRLKAWWKETCEFADIDENQPSVLDLLQAKCIARQAELEEQIRKEEKLPYKEQELPFDTELHSPLYESNTVVTVGNSLLRSFDEFPEPHME